MCLLFSIIKNMFVSKIKDTKTTHTQTNEYLVCYETESDFDSDVDSVCDAKPLCTLEKKID